MFHCNQHVLQSANSWKISILGENQQCRLIFFYYYYYSFLLFSPFFPPLMRLLFLLVAK